MDMFSYQEQTRRTAIYPGANGGDLRPALSYLAMGLASEAGEVAGKVKKYIRDGEFKVEDLESELGDVLWYVARMVDEIHGELDDVASKNLHKLADRKRRGVLGGSGDNR